VELEAWGGGGGRGKKPATTVSVRGENGVERAEEEPRKRGWLPGAMLHRHSKVYRLTERILGLSTYGPWWQHLGGEKKGSRVKTENPKTLPSKGRGKKGKSGTWHSERRETKTKKEQKERPRINVWGSTGACPNEVGEVRLEKEEDFVMM